MNKVIELAREVWGFENWTHVQLERIERFYQLARADLEAEIEVGAQQMRWIMHSHNKSFDDFTAKVAALEAENAKLKTQLHAMDTIVVGIQDERDEVEAENTELRTALDRAAKSLESRCAFGEADVARAALGEKDAEV